MRSVEDPSLLIMFAVVGIVGVLAWTVFHVAGAAIHLLRL